jgi:hypothetical protein
VFNTALYALPLQGQLKKWNLCSKAAQPKIAARHSSVLVLNPNSILYLRALYLEGVQASSLVEHLGQTC